MAEEAPMLFEENCGFNKWSIGISEDCAVVVKFNRWPNIGEVRLYDIVGNDLEKLASMFQNAVDYFAAKNLVNAVEAGKEQAQNE